MQALLEDRSFWIMTVPILLLVVVPVGIAIVAGTASLLRGDSSEEDDSAETPSAQGASTAADPAPSKK